MFPNCNFKYQISSYSLLYENMVIVVIAQKVIDILCTIYLQLQVCTTFYLAAEAGYGLVRFEEFIGVE